MRSLILPALLGFSAAFVLSSSPAQAHSRHHHVFQQHHALITKTTKANRLNRSGTLHKKHVHAKHPFGKYAHSRRRSAGRSLSLVGITPVLAAKVRQIVASCGSTVISAVSARGSRSNHPIGRAVDLRGNPGCVYTHLRGWPGGYSNDYASAGHIHISYNPGGQEWGLRFSHGGRSHGRYRTGRAYGKLRDHATRGFERTAYGSQAYAKALHRAQ